MNDKIPNQIVKAEYLFSQSLIVLRIAVCGQGLSIPATTLLPLTLKGSPPELLILLLQTNISYQQLRLRAQIPGPPGPRLRSPARSRRALASLEFLRADLGYLTARDRVSPAAR